MFLHIIASGSSGNCSCLEHNGKYIFIDAGVSLTNIKKSLGNIDLKSKDVSIFITHEHNDHISGLLPFINAFSPKVYTSGGTADILAKKGINEEKLFVMDSDVCYDFDDFAVTPFNITHDAAEPFGYKFHGGDTVFSIATDLGVAPDELLKSLEGTKTIMLESNYEDDILRRCGYPAVLKSRISSIHGHLSNKEAFKTVGELSRSGLERCFFSHVSENGNDYNLLDKYAAGCKECYTVETSVLHQGCYVGVAI